MALTAIATLPSFAAPAEVLPSFDLTVELYVSNPVPGFGLGGYGSGGFGS